MARKRTPNPTQLLLYTSLVPFAAVGVTILALSVLRSNAESAPPPPPPTPAELAARAESDARRDARRTFRECMENLGADLDPPRFRGRYSPRPDYSKIREAAATCQSLLSGGAGAPPGSSQGTSTPPVA
jgi:hypothetical protein